ncbi:amidohydrolase family protein [Bordetella holmesii]|uniref:Amidohydrolase family protein n=2 Tax=Bordetella holmesii TaxID=35814 RepID=A0ABN0RZ06_9BORD|nr:amidohydrolase family protein [Bordetella holmesii]AHV94534.1 amidohydrolase family protein [Bordetella holmesii ATCC 51541]EWM41304.1 amidohydrolase family protein [Bordetella holmesii 35009]EWM43923.1 amidohydrolase family protein [Bordetella holmesii 41130]EXF88506.1 amidohydrolase family protein [Bordetella holmesii 30539]AMD47473.1 hydrolase [Bordetella holmesii F627]
MPEGACDCHTHVFGPPSAYPFDPSRVYTPGPASIQQLRTQHGKLGISRVVIVQPSPYGADNRCTLDALSAYDPKDDDAARAVVVMDAHTSLSSLRDMHARGARGVRVNLKTGGQNDPDVARTLLLDASARVEQLGWHVQVFASLAVIERLADEIARLAVPVVLDHFAGLRGEAGVTQAGYRCLLDLLASGNVYIKLSAAQRASAAAAHEDMRPLVQGLVACRSDRLLWGSDWPHPGAWPGVARSAQGIEPFHPIDDAQALERLADWVGSQADWNAVMADNAARLYGWPD